MRQVYYYGGLAVISKESEAIVADILDFAEEHWEAFVQREQDRGYTEAEVEVKIEMLKEELHG